MTEAGATFEAWFQSLAGAKVEPYDWQSRLATNNEQPSSGMLRVPTGMGKTLGVLAAWSWHRVCRGDDRWPRRLVWCLPMRVLVEQTERVVRSCLARIGRLWDGAGSHSGKVGVHLLMGGVDAGGDWPLYPEECAVLIGTQDMLLSRALNRGYAAGRARWPAEFGLLNHDVLWVLDEVQLMDVGLATSAQLQAFCDDDASKGFRPRLSWWMSATLQRGWLDTVDTRPHHGRWVGSGMEVEADSLPSEMAAIRKQLRLEAVAGSVGASLAEICKVTHRGLADGDHGRITLVVCNTVDRACQTFEALCRDRQELDGADVRLVHSRFRGADRARWVDGFLGRESCRRGANRVIVATQVIEAGVDLSAGALVTELAPWPSLVQRFGRCARFGGNGKVVVTVPSDTIDDDDAAPYEAAELEAARDALSKLAGADGTGGDVGIASLDRFERALDQGLLSRLYRFDPPHLLLRREFEELFDTTPDLTGADIDISRFIRHGDERDVQVFWVDVPPDKTGQPPAVPDVRRRPGRGELCAVPFLVARDWLCGRAKKKTETPPKRLRKGMRAWTWDWIEGRWTTVVREALLPGRVVCVAADCGGYTTVRGFDEQSDDPVPPVQTASLPPAVEVAARADDTAHADETSQAAWKTIATHASEVAQVAGAIASNLALPARYRDLFTTAARWHDLGKAHPAFQGAIRHPERPDRDDLAKAPEPAWLRPPGTYRTRDDRDQRPGFRHELASLLGLFGLLRLRRPNHPALLGQLAEALAALGWDPPPSETQPASPVEDEILNCPQDDFDLLAYLVVSHHGKVRTTLHAGPKDQDYEDPGDGAGLPIRGVRDGDRLPPTVLEVGKPPVSGLVLHLDPAGLGLSPRTGRSWNERSLELVQRFGPGALAWLESIFIAADRRASTSAAPDPELAGRTAP